MTLTLYGGARSRASMPRWYMEEKEIPHAWVKLDMEAGEHRRAPFTDLQPFGKVPLLVDDGFLGVDGQPLRLFESGAILLHLAEHQGGEFSGENAAVRRSLTAQWVLFANSTLATALFVPSSREKEFPRLMEVLDGLLAQGGSLLGEGPWGAADCAVQSYLAYIPVFFPQVDLGPYPAVLSLIGATRQRPAYQRVMGAR